MGSERLRDDEPAPVPMTDLRYARQLLGKALSEMKRPRNAALYDEIQNLLECQPDAVLATREGAGAEHPHPRLGTHLRHCNLGENRGHCKYGDDDCPAMGEWQWIGLRVGLLSDRAEQAEAQLATAQREAQVLTKYWHERRDHLVRLLEAAEARVTALEKWHEDIVALSAGWDEDGSLGPQSPLSWESVGRMAMDYARAALLTPAAPRAPGGAES